MALITTGFGHDTTAAEAVAGIDLTGRRVVVTGGGSGIGIETARALAASGADVTIAVRDMAQGAAAAAGIGASTQQAVRVAHLDLADQDSVAEFTAAWDGPLDVLVANAGVMASPEARTPEGWELQFATNHLGHLALALGLHPALAAAGAARIGSVSSGGHRASPVVSTTSTSCAGPTSRGPPTASRRPRTCCSPSRPPAAGRGTASPPTP
nr:SDR family NAD(P)-dependent oxidoreductase [Miltoncostaea oceani]